MCHTYRVARRTVIMVVLGVAALASFLLPGPNSALASAAATPLAPGSTTEQPIADLGPPKPPEVISGTSVAFGGGVYLSVYDNKRPDWGGRIQATRVSSTGALLDPDGIVLSDGFLGPRGTAVAFDGTNFLVTWANGDSIEGRRVSPDGDVLDASVLRISTRETFGEAPAVDFDGENFLVAWTSPSTPGGSSGDIFARRVSPQGTVIDAGDLTLSSDPADQRAVAVAFNGTHHLLAWNHDRVIHGTLVDRAGVPQSPSGTQLASGELAHAGPAVASVGTSFFVAWTRERPDGQFIYGARVSPAGAVVDPAGIPISTGGHGQVTPAVVSNGTSVLVTWVEDFSGNPRARYTRVDPASGVVLNPEGRPLPAMWGALGVASDGTDYLVATEGVAVRLTSSGDVIAPGRIVFSAVRSAQVDLDTAFDGTNSFVVWTDDRYGDERIFGARVGPDGQRIDGSGISISTPPEVLDTRPLQHSSPAVAFDGTNFLVAWYEYQRPDGWPLDGIPVIQGARVSISGQVLDRFQIDAVGAGWKDNVDVAFGDGVFMVVWDQADGELFGEIYGTRVSPAGVVLDPRSTRLDRPVGDWALEIASDPAVAHGTSGFTVVWQERDILGDVEWAVRWAQVSSTGAVVRPEAAMVDGPGEETEPDVAWLDGTYLVVWQDRRSTGQVYGARVDGAGTILDPAGIPISTGPAGGGSPSVAANGVFLVALTRYGEGGPDIVATSVTTGGVVGGTRIVAESPAPEDQAGIAPIAGTPNFAVGFERFDAPNGADRGYLRHVAPK